MEIPAQGYLGMINPGINALLNQIIALEDLNSKHKQFGCVKPNKSGQTLVMYQSIPSPTIPRAISFDGRIPYPRAKKSSTPPGL